jgi:hypothetical protein
MGPGSTPEHDIETDSHRTDRPQPQSGPGFVGLWFIVTALWTISAIMRMKRVWVPLMGWPAVLGSIYTWVSLCLPPWMFAIILLATKRLATARR